MSRAINPELFYLDKVRLYFPTDEDRNKYLGSIDETINSMRFQEDRISVSIKADWNFLKHSGDNVLVITASGYTKASIKDRDVRIRMYSHYVEAYIYYCFLAINISVPGCFSLYLSSLYHTELHEVTREFRMAADILEASTNSDNGWPLIESVDLKQVVKWLERVGYGTKQVASTPIQKALFSFLYLSLANDWFTEAVLWLSYCLEGLYDSPAFGIKQTLINRIALVLGPPTNAQKRSIGKFYDLRSSLFHGRMSICHPMDNEILDGTVHSRWESDDIKSVFMATCVVIASIQELVKRGFRGFDFSEKFQGHEL